MSEFSQLLTEHIHQKDVRIYSLAEYCNTDRSLMYKIIRGKRMPASMKSVERIAEFLRLTPSEEQELRTAYRISLQGRDNYYRRLDIMNFLDHFREILDPAASSMPLGSFTSSDSPNIPLSTAYEVRQAAYTVINRLAEADSPHLYLMLPPGSEFIGDLMIPLVKWKLSASIDHIMCLNNTEQVTRENRNYNLHCLMNILPLCISGCSYQPYYYYDNINSRLDSFQLFPYLILTESRAVLVSGDFNSGILTRQPDLLQLLKKIFSEYLSQARPLLRMISNAAEQLSYVQECISTESGKEYLFQMTPCMTGLLSEDFLRKYIRTDVPQRELFIQNLLSHIKKVNQRHRKETVIHIFSEDGVEEFLKTGILEEYPSDIYQVPEPVDRLTLVRKFIDECRTGGYQIKMLRHNIGTVKNGANIYITPNAGYLLFTPIDTSTPVYLNIQESGLTTAFWDFFESMDDSLFYSREEAILRLDDLIRKYQII